MMKRLSIFLFLLISALMLQSCKKENIGDCFKKTGTINREKRMLEAFDSLILSNRITLVLIEDSVDFAEIEAGNNLIDLIRTDVKDRKLTIENNNKCNWVRNYESPVNVYLHYKKLQRIVMYGSSTITNRDTLRTDSLKIEFRDASGNVALTINNKFLNIIQHTGAGDAVIRGRTDALFVYCASLGLCNTRDLSAGYVFVESYSAADCRVFGRDSLDLIAHRDGSIYYYGPGVLTYQFRDGEGTISRAY